MPYYSTNNKQGKTVSLRHAVLKGLAEDGGLYMPVNIPVLPDSFFKRLPNLSLTEIAYEVASALLGNDVPDDVLKPLIEETMNFDMPLVEVEPGIYSLELFHGPTMAFKDIGARFMSRLMAYFNKGNKKPLKIIVATSGDTGSAVAAGFYNVPGIEVYILFPKGKVSPLQQKQLTTWGGNNTALEVDGTFDDCQRLAKQVLADKELNEKHQFSSANSINIARLIPQSFYYFYAFGQLQHLGKPIVFSVPSGNYGNLTGGLIAAAMGLPVHRFIAATNANSIVPHYLNTGVFEPQPSVQTISNAMDVGNPSNFGRMQALFDNDLETFKSKLTGYTLSDAATKQAILDVSQKHGYLLDPHGAIAFKGAKSFIDTASIPITAVFLETAHPAKFKEVIDSILPLSISIPGKLRAFAEKKERKISIKNSFEDLKALLEK